MTPERIAEYLAFAHTLADAAAGETLSRFRAALNIDNKGTGEFDPVTQADRAAEDIIRQRIKAAYPGHGLLGEERGSEAGNEPLRWVIDPIDGTRAYMCGIPLWTTLIALNDGTRPVIGVIDQPYLGERYYASPAGAFMRMGEQLRPLKTRANARLDDAVFSTTSPGLFQSAREKKIHEALVASVKLARYGCDAYAYAQLAAGTIDLVVEPGLQAWDIQALLPVIEAAGGAVATFDGGDPQKGGDIVAAANPALLKACLALISSTK